VSRKFAAGANRRLKFENFRQLFIRTHNETLAAVAMRVSNEDCSHAITSVLNGVDSFGCWAE
jgi:hypothetical protein